MPIYRRVSGAWQTATAKRRNGSFVNAASVKVRSGGAWVEKLAVAISITGPAGASGYAEDRVAPYAPTANVSTNTTLTVSGGNGVYAYSWALISGTAMTLSSTTTLNPSFSGTIGSNQTRSATYRLTVTSNGLTATKDVSITLTYESGVPL